MCVVGSLPLVAAGLTRSESLRQWAVEEATSIFKTQLGLEAQFELQLSVWPLGIELNELALLSTDGGSPALQAPRLVIRPRLFSLLAGKLSAGHISLESPRVRLVVRDSQLANLANLDLRSDSNSPVLVPAFSSLAITDAFVVVDLGDTTLTATAVDLDIFAGSKKALEVALRISHGLVTNRRSTAFDEDVLCQLDARLRLTEETILVRRLSFLGAIDADQAKDTAPTCDTNVLTSDPNRILLRLSSLSATHTNGEVQQATGHVLVRTPLTLVDRYWDAAKVSGWLALSGDLNLTESGALPNFHGKLKAGSLHLDQFTLAHAVKAEIHMLPGRLLIPNGDVTYGDGQIAVSGVSIQLDQPELPLRVASAKLVGLGFQSLMEGLGITPNTIVQWDLTNALLKDFEGSLSPLLLRGNLAARTRNFQVFDRSVHATDRVGVIGVKSSHLIGTFGVHHDSIRFDDFDVRFGNSSLRAGVHLGFDSRISMTIRPGSVVDLEDVSPVAGLPWSGKATVGVEMSGPMNNPELKGSLNIKDFSFSGFPLGDLSAPEIRFVPLRLELPKATLLSRNSHYDLQDALLDFDTKATVAASARVNATRFYLSDFYRMWHLDKDPRWAGLAAQGQLLANVRYTLGGPEDRCGTGTLNVRGNSHFSRLSAYGEHYRKAAADFDFQWFDIAAGHKGMSLNVPSLNAHKGSGTLSGKFDIHPGGGLSAEILASRIPLAAIETLSNVVSASGRLSAQVEVTGSLDAMKASVATQISKVRVGKARLPSSSLSVELEPVLATQQVVGKTACGAPIGAPFDISEYEADKPKGVFHINGKLFGEQIRLDDIQVTHQANKHLRGLLTLDQFDLQAVTQAVPELAALNYSPTGVLTGRLAIEDYPLARMPATRADLTIDDLSVRFENAEFRLSPKSHIRLGHGQLRIDPTSLSVLTTSGQSGEFTLRGTLSHLTSTPQVDFKATLKPASLDTFRSLIPSAEKASGRIEGALSISGPLAEPSYTGNAQLKSAAIRFRGPPHSITELSATMSVRPGELQLGRAQFKLGGGNVSVRATAPLRGMTLGQVQAYITARNVELPLPTGLRASVNAELQARFAAAVQAPSAKRNLPRIVGSVSLNSLSYSRPVRISADISDLAQRGKRTEFDAYQLDGDVFSFDIGVRSLEPMRLNNNLIKASLTIENEILHVTGTNQRFGVRGALKIVPGGHVHLRQNDFEIQQGRVRFDDPSRVVPLVDVTAVTDYRRYGSKTTSGVTTPLSGSNANVGEWRITMRAHGDADTLRIDLESQPSLSEDDIFLLLTVGLTRAEIDQLERSNISETVALEALSALTGADQAVKEAIPVIDEFRFGSAYSQRTAQTETTITIGKQLSERIRAFVTSGVGESRDVRSNVQVKINKKVSIEGSYDTINDLSSSSIGNLGADVRWRLDFE